MANEVRRAATYQQPPLPVERERARSAADELGGVLRGLPCSFSASRATAAGAEDGETGDASWSRTVLVSISAWSDSGEEGWLLLLGDSAALVSNAMLK